MKYWLVKTEPSVFSWENLLRKKEKVTSWEGVRNYQARNNLKSMRMGDLCFFYHSNAKPLAIMGICEVVKEAYPDTTAFDPNSPYYDPKSDQTNPRWFMTDLQAVHSFANPIQRKDIQNVTGLAKMELLKKGSMLSVQPVTPQEWQIIMRFSHECKN